MPFNKQKLQPLLKDGIIVGTTQLRLSPKHLSKDWQRVLEEVVKRIEGQSDIIYP
jgi:hypothetical protein